MTKTTFIYFYLKSFIFPLNTATDVYTKCGVSVTVRTRDLDTYYSVADWVSVAECLAYIF